MSNELTPMMKQYMQTKEEYKDCILFYRLGDFYEMFFDDALTASKELEITLTGKNCGLEERAPMCGIPYHAVDSYLNRLVSKGYKVAICEQVDLPDIVKLNFPSKKTFSKILNRSQSEMSTSYDSIRKCLILLKFYHFWVTLELMMDSGNAAENSQSDYADYFDDFCEEMAQLLEECGYEELYERNPYDWIFLWASTTEQPLESFRGVMRAIDFDDSER